MNKDKKIIIVLVIIIIVLVVGVLAFVMGKNYKEKNELPVVGNLPQENHVVDNTNTDCLPTTTPWIKVISPNGGETYTAGQQLAVKWQSCNVPASSHDIFVALHQDGEFKNVSYLSNATINDGSEIFTIPSVPSGNYKIRVGSSSARVGQDYSDNFFTINSTTNQNNIITKNDWGVSFAKMADWDIVTNTNNEVSLKQNVGQWEGDVIKISYVSGQSITDTDAKFGNITYFYDVNSSQWMKTTNENGVVTSVATVSFYTTNNLPVFYGTGRWKTYIVSTSNTTFIKLNISGSGQSQPLTDLLQTIKKI